MQQFNMRQDKAFFDTINKEKSALGIRSVSAFVRYVVGNFPYRETDRRWSDRDMKEFAKRWEERKPNPLGVLEDPALQMEREFKQFKQDFLTSK